MLTRPRSQEQATEGGRERERKEVSTEGATWSYKGGERERSAYARVSGKEKRKERKGQRRATGMPTTTSMGEGKATKRDDFFRILRTDHPSPPLPNAERNNSPRGGRGLKSAATESPIIFRSLSFPPNQRIKASLRGPASTSPPRVPRSFNEGRRRREDVGWTRRSLSLSLLNTFLLASRKLDCVDPSWTRNRGAKETSAWVPPSEKSRWMMTIVEWSRPLGCVPISFRLSFGGGSFRWIWGRKSRIVGLCKGN